MIVKTLLIINAEVISSCILTWNKEHYPVQCPIYLFCILILKILNPIGFWGMAGTSQWHWCIFHVMACLCWLLNWNIISCQNGSLPRINAKDWDFESISRLSPYRSSISVNCIKTEISFLHCRMHGWAPRYPFPYHKGSYCQTNCQNSVYIVTWSFQELNLTLVPLLFKAEVEHNLRRRKLEELLIFSSTFLPFPYCIQVFQVPCRWLGDNYLIHLEFVFCYSV